MAASAKCHNPLGIKVIFVGMKRNRPDVVRVELARALTPNTAIAIAPEYKPPNASPPKVTVNRSA